MLLATLTASASEPTKRRMGIEGDIQNTGSELGSYTFIANKGQVKTSVQCIDGYKFAIVAMVGHQSAPGPAVDIIQIYNSGSAPAKC